MSHVARTQLDATSVWILFVHALVDQQTVSTSISSKISNMAKQASAKGSSTVSTRWRDIHYILCLLLQHSTVLQLLALIWSIRVLR